MRCRQRIADVSAMTAPAAQSPATRALASEWAKRAAASAGCVHGTSESPLTMTATWSPRHAAKTFVTQGASEEEWRRPITMSRAPSSCYRLQGRGLSKWTAQQRSTSHPSRSRLLSLSRPQAPRSPHPRTRSHANAHSTRQPEQPALATQQLCQQQCQYRYQQSLQWQALSSPVQLPWLPYHPHRSEHWQNRTCQCPSARTRRIRCPPLQPDVDRLRLGRHWQRMGGGIRRTCPSQHHRLHRPPAWQPQTTLMTTRWRRTMRWPMCQCQWRLRLRRQCQCQSWMMWQARKWR